MRRAPSEGGSAANPGVAPAEKVPGVSWELGALEARGSLRAVGYSTIQGASGSALDALKQNRAQFSRFSLRSDGYRW